ncbi:MAG: hypothetical protein WA907_03665 [Erythrobacter sp.]
MRRFLSPNANRLILRHFHLGAQIMRFIADNATPGFRPELERMEPRRIEDVEDNLFLKHDLNIYNFLIQLNAKMERRGTSIERRDLLDFSAIDEEVDLEALPDGKLNGIDLATAIEVYTPAYALLLTARDFWRAANSLQLDETIALYVARLTGGGETAGPREQSPSAGADDNTACGPPPDVTRPRYRGSPRDAAADETPITK